MDFSRTRAVIDSAIEKHEENGTAVVVTYGGEKAYSYSAGLADTENRTAFGEKTICRAFSCTKIVTAVAAGILIERGKLDINWKLEWFFPEFSAPYYYNNGKKTESPSITIRDLLNMTSGIPYPGDTREGGEEISAAWGKLDSSIRDGNSMTTQEFAACIGKLPLMFPAGQEWMYGSSADILGAVIEKLADKKLSDFYTENIFSPLGMNDTAFYVPQEKRSRLAVLYNNAGENPTKPDYVNLCIFDYDSEPKFQSGGAGLFSTAEDYSKLGAALSDGGHGIISGKAIEFLSENALTPMQRKSFTWDSTRGFGYANLMRCLESRNEAGLFASKGSFGWDGWTGTYLLCDPAEKLSVTVFLQRCGAGTSQLSRNVVNSVYSAIQ